MLRAHAPVSLADLGAAGVRLRPLEVVTIVRDLAQQVARGDLPGVPSVHVIRLSPSGSVFIEGPVAAGGPSVARAAQLLETLLPGFDAPPEFRAPGGLRLAVARALGTLDLPPYATLEAFSEALARFGAPDTAPVVRQLVASWAESVAAAQHDGNFDTPATDAELDDVRERVLEAFAPAVPMPIVPVVGSELTVSDVRRARRATGLSLNEVADRSDIPIKLLRELEWGFVRDWPTGHSGRIQLVRYAQAAGLDEEIVIRAVWPLLQEESARVDVLEPLPMAVGELPLSRPLTFGASHTRASGDSRGARVLAALAIPVLLAVALAPAVWHQMNTPRLSPAPSTRGDTDARSGQAQSTRGDTDARSGQAPSTRGEADARSGQPPPAVTAMNEPARSESPRQVRQPGAITREPDRLVPPTAPAAGLVNQPVSASDTEPSFSSVGTAMFHDADADDDASSALPQDSERRGPVLRITRIVDDTARSFHARPSPDGRRIAFDSDRNGERAVYVAEANGKQVRRISGEGFAAVPSWSPDSQRLAFVKAEPGKPQVWNVWTADLTTGATRRVTNHADGQPWGGSWFPDGQRIAYSIADQLIVLDLQTSSQQNYSSPRRAHDVRFPTVSPDGQRLIFQVRRDGTWLLDLTDGSMRRVLSDPTAEEYTWARDGSRVAYYSRRGASWGVWVRAPR